MAAVRAVADRREGLARLVGQVNALRARGRAGAEEIERLAAAAGQAQARAARAEADLERIQDEAGALDDGEVGLDERHEAARAGYDRTAARLQELTELRVAAQAQESTWAARRDALAIGLSRRDGAGALLDAGPALPGVLGSVAALLTVEPGYETALAAALGPVADAVAVDSARHATDAIILLKDKDAGRAGLLVGADGAEGGADIDRAGDRGGWPDLPPGARWAIDLVAAPAPVRVSVAHALRLVAVVADLGAALDLVDGQAGIRAVTPQGDVLGSTYAVGGSASAPSALEVQAEVDEAGRQAADAAARAEAARDESDRLDVIARSQQGEVENSLRALHESDARLSAVTEQLAQLGQTARSAHAEADRLRAAGAEAGRVHDRDRSGLLELEQRLAAAESVDPAGADEPSAVVRDALWAQVVEVRQAEVEARLAVRTVEERVRALAGRAEALERAARDERQARRRAERVRRDRARSASAAAAVHRAAEATLVHIARSRQRSAQERDQLEAERARHATELADVRNQAREVSLAVGQLTDAVHRDEVLRAEQRLRIEQVEQRAAEEFGVEPDALVAEYGPDQPTPPSAQETAEYEQARDRGEEVVAPQPGPFHRASQEKRAARAERDLALLGRVNPLALEEFAALEERHQFLATQLEDIRDTRRDLLNVIREVDERILEVFTAAYHDVAREFETVFTTLFPGGEGRLVLTQPDDMLATGIEVEARPPGKKVKRLSLLSGGERSLTAVALLVAIFRARPSPFYVLDEVEAALDDVNLGRLIALIGELRDSSQIIVVTHQKRTMEIADALYGVTMRDDGITQVISQRLRDRPAAGPTTTAQPPQPTPALLPE